MFNTLLFIGTLLSISNPSFEANSSMGQNSAEEAVQYQSNIASKRSISLSNRHKNEFVNGVFRDNILLTLNYIDGSVKNKAEIEWEAIRKPRFYKFTLEPGERFAFHDQMLKEYSEGNIKTTHAHFNYQDGFKSSGYLMGDGVCHLASLIYWAAKDAGLEAISPVNHDFASINEIPKEYGVSIYYMPGSFSTGANQNLYIKNTSETAISFVFKYDGNDLTLQIVKS